MAITYPTSVTSYTAPAGTDNVAVPVGGRTLADFLADHGLDIAAIETKLGIGAASPGEGKGLIGTASGTDYLGTMVRLDKQTLGSNTTQINFTSISQVYSALRIQVVARSTVAGTSDNFFLQMAPQSTGTIDTGANYDYNGLQIISTGSFPEGNVAQTSINCGYLPGSTGASGEAVSNIIDIPNYAGTVFNKRINSVGGYRSGTTATTVTSQQFTGDWRNTAAIGAIRLTCGSQFATGSVFVLWGIY